jgi:hypothetical protein
MRAQCDTLAVPKRAHAVVFTTDPVALVELVLVPVLAFALSSHFA